MLASVLMVLAAVAPGYQLPSGGILAASRVRPIAAVAPDALRFSSTPALGGIARIVELRRAGNGATGTVTLFRGHPGLGWNRLSSRTVTLSGARYAALAAGVDRALGQGVPDPTVNGASVICLDGPGYVTERSNGGHDWRLDGFCGDAHPNTIIARLIGEAVGPDR